MSQRIWNNLLENSESLSIEIHEGKGASWYYTILAEHPATA
jgi:hypothetical protein